MCPNSAIESQTLADSAHPSLGQASIAQHAARDLELKTLLEDLAERGTPPIPAQLRHLRSLLISAGPEANPSLKLLDSVLDSPLDVDSSVLRQLQAGLASARATDICIHGEHRNQRPGESMETPAKSAFPEMEALVSQFRSTSRTLQQQARTLQHDRQAFVQIESKVKSDPDYPVPQEVSGLHVRQGGHDFLVPIEFIERAMPVVAKLPTVMGIPVSDVAGEMCDVLNLADLLGLPKAHSLPTTLLIVSIAGKRTCLAVDEVVGSVRASAIPLGRILPSAKAGINVATLDTGCLAMVPDLADLATRNPA